MKSARLSLALRLGLGMVGVVIVGVGITLGINLWIQGDLVQEAEQRQLEATYGRFTARVDVQSQRGSDLAAMVSQMPEVQAAFAARDRARLQELLLPTFPNMKAEHGVQQFQFHLSPATSFLRLHKPEKFGDDLSGFRKTVVAVNSTQKPVTGLELGVAGLGVRAVRPMFHNGEHTGSVEFGMALNEKLFQSFSNLTGAKLALYLKRESGFENFASTFANSVVFTDAQLTPALSGEVRLAQVTMGDSTYAVLAGPVTDYQGEPIGVTVLAMDNSAYVSALSEGRTLSALTGGAALLLAFAVAFLFHRSVGLPLTRMAGAMGSLAKGDTDIDIPAKGRSDEVGDMAEALDVFRTNQQEMHRLEADREQSELRTAEEKRKSMVNVLHGLVDGAMQSNEVMVLLGRMKREVTEANRRVQAMASAVEEMGASIRSIASNSETATSDATEAEGAASEGLTKSDSAVATMEEIVGSVTSAAGEVNSLAEASTQIGEIVGEIEAIAEQTNLLALNATIEAARAGDAGKGFAVVASEVKNLANQTAKATEDIRERIENLRTEMDVIVKSMSSSAGVVESGQEVIHELGEQLRTISSDINNVTGRMSEISSILGEQTQASQEISSGTASVAEISEQNDHEIDEVLVAMDALNEALGTQVGAFADYGDRAIVEIAKNDHAAFNRNVLNGILKRADVTSNALPDHHTCRLGKWYDALEDPEIKSDPAFKALVEPHKLVHELGRKALEKAEGHDLEGALAMVDPLNAASKKVISHLDELSKHLEASGR